MTLALVERPTTQDFPRLEDLLIPEQEQHSESFTIDSPEKAAWASRKILDAQDHLTQLKEQASSYKAQIDAWFQKAIKEDEESVDYLKSLIHPYVEVEVSKQHKSKTLHLPGIAAQLRKKPDRIDVVDKDTAVSFCEMNHPDAVIIKKDVSKSYLKVLLSKGEVIPGCNIAFGENEIYFKDEG
jgi:phage host-nuclease inhibitor protein Gam